LEKSTANVSTLGAVRKFVRSQPGGSLTSSATSGGHLRTQLAVVEADSGSREQDDFV